MSGRVAVVGAGPGDPELLTLKAARLLREADVVLHDALVAPEILALAGHGARLIAVGKRGGCRRSTPQRFVEQLLIREARAGHSVVRLKSGDPFVFGRGGEELAALRAAGVTVEVVGGITAGLAAPAAVGIPVTHRALAHGVALVTGHAADGGAELDWHALIRTGLTLVIYMGMMRVGELSAKLLAAGMPSVTRVAIIANATRPAQDAVVTSLGALAEDAQVAGLASPAIIVVGEVVALAEPTSVRPIIVGSRKVAIAGA
jgi:uroporphyrin-III C-methyltransferase